MRAGPSLNAIVHAMEMSYITAGESHKSLIPSEIILAREELTVKQLLNNIVSHGLK